LHLHEIAGTPLRRASASIEWADQSIEKRQQPTPTRTDRDQSIDRLADGDCRRRSIDRCDVSKRVDWSIDRSIEQAMRADL
jgi:hypothetical protein